MRYIIFLLAIIFSVQVLANNDILVKTDGTKYYIQVYDGVTNEKVLFHNSNQGDWKTKLRVADYFDGSSNQLWSFEATDMFPGYFSIVSHDEGLTPVHHLMSWNWNAYFADNRDPLSDKEMQYRFVEAFDGYFILEAIEKPTDGSLYGINYTPGADALNIKPDGWASFSEVKSADITQANMANKVFKLIEFNPMALFEESIVRGDELYNNNPNAPEMVRYDLFYTLEKAREVRVFGSEAEMLAFQANIDAAISQFNQAVSLLTLISDARTFINESAADNDVKAAFNAIVDNAEAFLLSDDLDYTEISTVEAKITNSKAFVNAILAALVYNETLAGQDARLGTGMMMAVDSAKLILADASSDEAAYGEMISYLSKTEALLDEIIAANDLIAATQEFQEAKDALNLVIETAITTVNTSGVSGEQLDFALENVKAAVKVFQKALEAGDTVVELKNANFDGGSSDWNWDTDTPSAVRPSAKGVDGSKSMTIWNGGAYYMKFFQSITGIPNGVYILSAVIQTNIDSSFELFAECGTNISETPITLGSGGLELRNIEIEVVDGELEFGVRGAGENNGLGGGSWVVMDDFELKWSSNLPVKNANFDDGITDWTRESPMPGAAYPSNKGVDGSASITCWNGGAYQMKFYQTLNVPNGTYAVSAMANTNVDGVFEVFGESNGVIATVAVVGSALAKVKTTIEVTDGILNIGLKGAGENNGVPAGNWVVFDDIEVVRLPNIPLVNANFDDDKTGWITDSPTPGSAYPSKKGVDGSASITSWSGAAYQMKFYQTVSGIANGTYSVSAFVSTNRDGAFNLFAEGGSEESLLSVTTEGGLAKRQIEFVVADGSADIGLKGAGENNGLEAGSWFVVDDFGLLLKSIVPDYVTPDLKQFTTSIDKMDAVKEITYKQSNQYLNVRSTENMLEYSVYSINGSRVDRKQVYGNELSIPMKRGVFIVRIITNDGLVHNKKIVIQ